MIYRILTFISMSVRKYVLFILMAISVFVLSQCFSIDDEREKKIVTGQCGSCHTPPDPESLTQEIWKSSVLPQMSIYFQWEGSSSYEYANKSFYRKKATLPMNDKTWALIESYYVDNSPIEMIIREESAHKIQDLFQEIPFSNICGTPSISAMLIDDKDKIYCACNGALVCLSHLKDVDTLLRSESIISDIERVDEENLLLLNMGVLGPHDTPQGSLNLFDETDKKEATIVSQLYRPVKVSITDDHYLISEYGNNRGRFSSINKSSLQHTSLIELPGSYQNFLVDIDKDGTTERIIQFSQGLEGIYMMNEDDEKIDYKRIISFPPEYGFSDLDTADMNQDGLLDLIISNGDNADYSYIEKSYHGVRIFLNDGKGQFIEDYFYPMYGATQLSVHDFDGDGDQDIVVSAFFPHDQSKSIILLTQDDSNKLSFEDSYMESSQDGRWLVMEDGDVDADGDIDIVLASFVAGPTNDKPSVLKGWLDKSVDILILLNKSQN